MSFDREAVTRAVAARDRIVRVVVAHVDGSAPREVGAAMLVWADGQSGTIGGGALEFEAAKTARGMLADRRAARLDRIALGPAMGQCCGGAVTLVSEVFDAATLNTVPDHVFARNIDGPATPPLPVRRALADLRNAGQPPRPQLVQGWMIEPVMPTATPLWIYGAGHVGRALVATLSPLPDFAITWVDTGPERFPDAVPDNVTRLIAANPADLVRFAPVDAQHLILTYSHALDLDLCHQVLTHGFGGAGLIGSTTKWARFRKRLTQLGHSDARISCIRCPIGHPELGKHPQAIALGVAATLLSHENAAKSARGAAG
ncbi:xanthine dehydrogenase accessory protein XdhC [Actibacterium sp. D379-3]